MPKRSALSKPKYDALSLLILLAVFVAQYVFFKNYVLGEVAPYYPANHDQAFYLKDAYRLFEDMKANGLAALLGELFSPRAAQGKLLSTQASVLFMLAEPSRLVALFPNLFYFLLLQASVFYLMKRAAGGQLFSFIAVGAVLMLGYPFHEHWAGTLFDFRMDFQAFCLYGIFVTAAIRSGAFLSGGWTVAATAIGFLLVLLRHVALGYLGGVYMATLALLSAVYLFSGAADRKKNAARRIRNAVLSGGAVLGAAFPFLWASRTAIYNYYGIGHFLGREKDIRSPGETIGTNAVFYLEKLYAHIGWPAASLLAALFVTGVALSVCCRAMPRQSEGEAPGRIFSTESFAFLVISAVAPFLVFIVDMNRSPVVGAVMVAPVVLFCVLVFSRRARWGESGAVKAALLAVAIAAMALGLWNQRAHYNAAISPYKRGALEAITRMSLEIGDYAIKSGIAEPRISFDSMLDYLADASITVVNYEERRQFIGFKVKLGGGIFEISEDEAVKKLKDSDIVVFSPDMTGNPVYPFDRSINAMKPRLLPVLEKEFVKINEFGVYRWKYYLLARPQGDNGLGVSSPS
jgi:hypothetical protein